MQLSDILHKLVDHLPHIGANERAELHQLIEEDRPKAAADAAPAPAPSAAPFAADSQGTAEAVHNEPAGA
jgi:hypothetical protein